MFSQATMVSFAAVVIVRVSLLLGLAAFVVALMRRSSAAARHLVWTCALAGSLAIPLLSLWGPAWDLPILPAIQSAAMASSSRDLAENAVASATFPGRLGTNAVAAASAPATRPRSSVTARAASQIVPLPLLLWAAGMFLVVARLAFGTFRMTWIARRATRVGSGRWLRVAERLADTLGVARRVVFLEGGPSAMPMTWGVVTSRVLMPRAAEAWPADRQRVVLLHELAHVKRRDCLTQLVAQLACAFYWFNPLAWFAAKRLRAEREHACDDLVLASGTRGSDYADHLIEIARSMRSAMAPTWAAVAMAHRSQLEGRLMAILDPHIPRRFPSRRRAAGLVAFMTVFVVPIALITPAPRAAETASPAQFAESPVTPAAQPAPAPTSQSVRSDQATREATKRSVREALRPTVESTAAAIGSAVVQAVKEGVAGGIKEGIAGGIQGGIKGGIPQEVEREIEQEAQDKTARRDPRVVAALVEALKDTDKEVRESAMQALANLRAPEALDAIRASLKDTNPSVRQQAAFALGQYRDGGSVDALAGLLADSSADVREQAVFAMGQIRDPRSAAPLMQALKDSDGSVREQAAFALGQLRSKEAVEPLSVALQDRSADVREQAAFALGQIRDRRAVDSLVTALKDQSADVREQAAFALGQLRDPRATDGLTAALKDSNVDVRRQAAFALGQIR